ncbi:SDR family NAD(P)-dependent oxidoreductase [Bacillus sp. B1-b2]|uniref:SDR family NAD(P)-dependent oxidoreductase n=1 Tax=Bacillus sp. B1-b2 TaxID=2653201 RepID=UPI00126299AD|nr:SDR family NAD(P)-dependent oxidoreductase [Bacillus sp. B1-b2]KAB7671767.1 SDR family NAD(P)-dependent oxidoreductase [Bacillus sp. B1-b2]
MKVAMITGASKGIGLELTKKLIRENWEIIAVIRSNFSEEEKQIQDLILAKKIRIYRAADLADFQDLKRVLNEIKAQESKIDVLFNNAGGSFDRLYYSKQSRELHFEIQTVVPYIITMEMRDLLKKGTIGKVVNTSSNAFKFTKKLSYQELENPSSFKKLVGPYANSKLAVSLWSREAAAELKKEDITILSVDPGSNNTLRKGTEGGLPFIVQLMMKSFFSHPSKGASLLYEGAVGDNDAFSGAYLVKNKVTPLKFTTLSKEILHALKNIYTNEYLKK